MNAQAQHTTRYDPSSITRPDPALLTYYLLIAALTLIAFPFVFLPHYFKYKTLRYTFDDRGVSMSWGLLFKREIYLTYRRIQDIHVTRNLFHRWLGLASLAVQTASGAAGAEMTIEGIRNPEQLRDFLYSQMRGAQDHSETTDESSQSAEHAGDEALQLLTEIRDELRTWRAQQSSGATGGEASS